VIKSRRICLAGGFGTHGKEESAYRVLVERPEGKILLGRLRLILGINIKIDLQEMRWGHGLVDLSQDRDRWRTFVNYVMMLRVPKMWEITRLAEDLLASQERLWSMELV
jgi:hypothetical protein